MKIRIPFLKRVFGYIPYLDFSNILCFEFENTFFTEKDHQKQCRCGHPLHQHKVDFRTGKMQCHYCHCSIFISSGKECDPDFDMWLVADEDIEIIPFENDEPLEKEYYPKGTHFRASLKHPYLYRKHDITLDIPVDKCHEEWKKWDDLPENDDLIIVED